MLSRCIQHVVKLLSMCFQCVFNVFSIAAVCTPLSGLARAVFANAYEVWMSYADPHEAPMPMTIVDVNDQVERPTLEHPTRVAVDSSWDDIYGSDGPMTFSELVESLDKIIEALLTITFYLNMSLGCGIRRGDDHVDPRLAHMMHWLSDVFHWPVHEPDCGPQKLISVLIGCICTAFSVISKCCFCRYPDVH